MHRLTVYAVALGLISMPFMAHADCRMFTSHELRQAIIKKAIKVGMKTTDVKRSWGEPTKVRHAYPRGDEWEYWHPTGDQIVSFGPGGCVTGWRTVRD